VEGTPKGVVDKAFEAYQWAIDKGIAKKSQRKVLPEGLTKTRLYLKVQSALGFIIFNSEQMLQLKKNIELLLWKLPRLFQLYSQ
jgi:hypothetical protein